MLYGKDVFSGIAIDHERKLFRLRQMLPNLTLRLRGSCISHGQQPEQVTRILADLAGPLRAAAATLLELEGHTSETSTALTSLAASFGEPAAAIAQSILAAHQGISTEKEKSADILFQAIALIRQIAARADLLQEKTKHP